MLEGFIIIVLLLRFSFATRNFTTINKTIPTANKPTMVAMLMITGIELLELLEDLLPPLLVGVGVVTAFGCNIPVEKTTCSDQVYTIKT